VGLEKFKEISDMVAREEQVMKVKEVDLNKNKEILEKKEIELKEKQEKIIVLTEDCETKKKN